MNRIILHTFLAAASFSLTIGFLRSIHIHACSCGSFLVLLYIIAQYGQNHHLFCWWWAIGGSFCFLLWIALFRTLLNANTHVLVQIHNFSFPAWILNLFHIMKLLENENTIDRAPEVNQRDLMVNQYLLLMWHKHHRKSKMKCNI